MKTAIALTVLVMIGMAVYANSFGNGFVWDDLSYIQENMYLRGSSGLVPLLTQDTGAGSGYHSRFYRPFQMLTHFAEYRVFGLDPRGYHVVNTLLHVGVCLCVFWLASLLFGGTLRAFLAAALFAVHPIHTSAVLPVFGRADPLSSLCILLCLISYIRFFEREDPAAHALIAGSFALALLSKESSVVALFLVALYHVVFRKPFKAAKALSLTGVAAAYFVLRVTVVKVSLVPVAVPDIKTLLARIPGFFAAAAAYVRLLAAPFALRLEYGEGVFSILDPRAILGVLVFGLSALYAWRVRSTHRLIAFSVGWFWLTMLPVSNIFPVNISFMMEHWLYLPSIGIFMFAAGGLGALLAMPRLRPVLGAAVAVLAAFYATLTVRQNVHWKEPAGFYEWFLRYSPDSWRLHNQLGLVYASRGRNEEAVAEYKKALEINPRLAGTYSNLGNAYKNMGRHEEALQAYRQAADPAKKRTP